ncbi:MAG: hypothetical protein Q4C86_07340 [bacterium]|nr:hypothetical protein [bacterium]
MKKTTLYGVAAIISLLATFVLRHFWIAAGSGGSTALAVSMLASCALFSFAAAGYVTGGWTIRWR